MLHKTQLFSYNFVFMIPEFQSYESQDICITIFYRNEKNHTRWYNSNNWLFFSMNLIFLYFSQNIICFLYKIYKKVKVDIPWGVFFYSKFFYKNENNKRLIKVSNYNISNCIFIKIWIKFDWHLVFLDIFDI